MELMNDAGVIVRQLSSILKTHWELEEVPDDLFLCA